MRTCMYCGRELKDSELCTCSMATARRAAKSANDKDDKKHGAYYKTGYTADGKAARWKTRFKTKAEERKNRCARNKMAAKTLFSDVWRFLKSPIDGVLNPRNLPLFHILLLAAMQGALIGLGVYFVATGASRSRFAALASLVGFNGATGYKMLLSILMSAVGGAVSGTVFFLIYTGVFYLINRFVFRLHGTFSAMAQRLAFVTIPAAVLTAVGVLFSFFSTTTLMILMMCGGSITFILSYEALNCEWSVYSRTKSLYGVALGYFILFTLVCGLMRISIIGG